MTNQQPLTIAEVCELPAGNEDDHSWVNGGFRGTVYNIASKQSQAGKAYWVLTIGDSDNQASVQMSVFAAPRCQQGDEIEVVGTGLRRTEYNGQPQVAMSKTAEIHVVNRQAPKEPARMPAKGPETASEGSKSPQGAQGQPMHGATAGMAVKVALSAHLEAIGDPVDKGAALADLHFWVRVETTAVRIAKMCSALEAGKPAVKPAAPKPVAPPPPVEEDVPF